MIVRAFRHFKAKGLYNQYALVPVSAQVNSDVSNRKGILRKIVGSLFNINSSTRWGIINGLPSFNWHNLVNAEFIWTTFSDNIAEEMLNLHIWT